MSVIGIDLGTSDAIVASVGKGVVDIVRNEVSERKTPCVVGFTSKNRLIGEAAMTSIKSNYRNTCRNPKQLLGRAPNDPELEKERFFQICENAVAADGTAGYRVSYLDEEKVFSATEVSAMLLSKLKLTADSFTGAVSKDCVIAVPSYFEDAHRAAVLDAAHIAGLNCLRVMNDSTATALAYGIYRAKEFDDKKPTTVAFTSVGASHFGCSIVKFTQSHLTVIGEAIDTTVGGRYMDQKIMQTFAGEFSKKTGGLDPLSNGKCRYKLEEAINKVKKILSANNEATLGIECLMDDEDLHVVVSRDRLEEMCESMVPKIQGVLEKALKEAGISKEDLDSVEIVGGVSRVPFIQRTIVETLGKEVSHTLNADECVARGCALQAAMLSPLFKVRDFGVTDYTPRPVQVGWRAPADSESTPAEEVKRTDVFQAKSSLNLIKMLTFYRKDPFDIWAQYPGSEDGSLGKFHIEVPHSDTAQKIKVRAKLSLHGTFSVENALLITEEEYEVKEMERRLKAPTATPDASPAGDVTMSDASPANATTGSDANAAPTSEEEEDVCMKGADDSTKPGEEAATKEEDKYEEVEVTKTKTRTKKTEIPIIRTNVPGLNADTIEQEKSHEQAMKASDREVAETDERRNDLETYVFESRDKISSQSSAWYNFLSNAQRDEFSSVLLQAEDWIYDHYEATKAEYMDKLIAIRSLGDQAEYRATEYSLRGEAEARAHSAIQRYRSLAQSPDAQYSHIAPERKQHILEECQKFESWLSQKKAELSRQELCVNPTFTVTELESKTNELSKLADGILSEPKPAPPKAEPEEASATETNPSGEDSSSPAADKDTEPTVEEPEESKDMDVD